MLDFDEMTTDDLWEALPETEGLERGQLLLNLMGRNEEASEHVTALALAQQAVEVFQAGGHCREYSYAKAYEGRCQGKVGEFDIAVVCIGEAISSLNSVTDSAVIGLMHSSLAEVYEKNHQVYEAIMQYRCAAEILAELQDWENASDAPKSLVVLLLGLSDHEASLVESTKSYEYAKNFGNSESIMLTLQHLAYARQFNDFNESAIKTAKDALVIAKTCDCPSCVPDALFVLGKISFGCNEFENSTKYLRKAKAKFRKTQNVPSQTLCDIGLARITGQTKPKLGKKMLKDILTISDHLSFPWARLEAGMALAQIYADQNKSNKAIALYEEMSQCAQDNFKLKMDSKIALSLCKLYADAGEKDKVISLIARIEPVFVGTKEQRAELLVHK